MTPISALTLVKNRTAHLLQMLEGFRRGSLQPDELVIVDMDPVPPALPSLPFPVRRIHLPQGKLPLAQARNIAATAARFELLLFLDADCIPMRNLLRAIRQHLTAQDILICPEVRYLAENDARAAWDEDQLRGTALAHPVRVFPQHGLTACDNPGLFWSLAFGIRRTRFLELGGFDEGFTGYGAEDTDFGFRAHRADLPLMFLGGPNLGIGAFHQHHPVYHPPLQHFADILRNARRFHERWNRWPMQGWLSEFEQMGLIARAGAAIEILRAPTPAEVGAARSNRDRF